MELHQEETPSSVHHGLRHAWAQLKRYVTHDYVPTLMHAMFHLMAVLLAFILASAWNARETDIKDLNAKLGITNVLQREAAFNSGYAQDLLDRPATRRPPCPGIFFKNGKDGELAFSTTRWDGFNNSGQAVVLGTTRYAEHVTLYDRVDEAFRYLTNQPETTKRFGATEACTEALEKIQKDFKTLANLLGTEARKTEADVRTLQDSLWPPRFYSRIAKTFAVWLTIILMPVGIYAGQLAWQQWAHRRRAARKARRRLPSD